MAKAMWVRTTMSVAGTSIPTLTSTAIMDPAYRAVILAGMGSGNALFGYAPGSGNAGFRIRANVGTTNAATVLNALLNTAGVAVAQQYQTAGGVHVATAFCYDMDCGVSGQGELDMNAQFATTSVPIVGGSVGNVSGFGKAWRINDLTSVSLPGGTTATRLEAFRFRIQRPLTEFRGNSPFGLPQDLDVPTTLVTLDTTYQKLSDAEVTVAIAYPRTIADCFAILTQVDSASPASLTFKCGNAFHMKLPENSVSVNQYTMETANLASEDGSFTVS